jgi:hypothetical protein
MKDECSFVGERQKPGMVTSHAKACNIERQREATENLA